MRRLYWHRAAKCVGKSGWEKHTHTMRTGIQTYGHHVLQQRAIKENTVGNTHIRVRTFPPLEKKRGGGGAGVQHRGDRSGDNARAQRTLAKADIFKSESVHCLKRTKRIPAQQDMQLKLAAIAPCNNARSQETLVTTHEFRGEPHGERVFR
ncbi:hypothetical protein MRX96_015058 [Rhipicephalus microplus]